MAKSPERSYKLPNWIGLCGTCGRNKDVVKFCRAVVAMETEIA